MTQNRHDDEAITAYRRALEVEPENKDILRTLAATYFERNNYDETAVGIYHRSYERNPHDMQTLRALAHTAQLTANHELAVESIEAIARAGQMNQKLNLQLAKAYVKLG